MTVVFTEGDTRSLSWRGGKKSRCFQLDLNFIEIVCTLNKVALDFTSVLTLNLNINNVKKTGSKQFCQKS